MIKKNSLQRQREKAFAEIEKLRKKAKLSMTNEEIIAAKNYGRE